jgi:signal transduction histidine kinase/ligand-binding sensor domain-containing protein/DNA-binding response OmpR family regulator
MRNLIPYVSLSLFLVFGIDCRLMGQPSSLHNKDVVFDQLPAQLGLSQSSINCVLQDREGYLWIATWSGLIRYDGYETTVFHSDQRPGKIKSNKITTLYEDSRGNLWVGTHMEGLFLYEKNEERFKHFFHDPADPKSLSNNNVLAIQEDAAGRLWVGTSSGLNVFDGVNDEFIHYFNSDAETSLSHNHVIDITMLQSGQIWVATGSGINRMVRDANDRVTFERYYYRQDTVDAQLHNFTYQLSELVVDGKSTLWLSTMKGLKKWENGSIKNFMPDQSSSAYNHSRSLLVVDGEHPIIVMGSEMGLHFFDPKRETFTDFFNSESEKGRLSQGTVSALYIDRGGVLWVGTKSGLNKYNTYSKDFVAYSTSTFDKSQNIITGIQGATSGAYWVSTIGGGLFHLKDGIFHKVTLKGRGDNHFTDFIQTLYVDARGGVWIGTAGEGVYHFEEGDLDKSGNTITKYEHYHTGSTPALSQDVIMSLEEDRGGNMWVGMWFGGLNKINRDGEVTRFNHPQLSNAPVVDIHADLSDVLWIGTRGNGLYRVTPRKGELDVHVYRRNRGEEEGTIKNNFINAIFEDHAGTMWIGTEEGLVSFDRRTEVFQDVRINDGPSNGVIASILEDDNGHLWLAHWEGLTVIDPLDPGYSKNYDRHDRIKGGFFYNNVCYRDPGGKLLFGGSEGLNVITPDNVVVNRIQAPVVIRNFSVFNETIRYGKDFNGRVVVDQPLSQADIELKHDENTLAFEFSALDFAAPDKIHYAYRLEGLDKDWNYTTASRRYVNYTNLDYGHYVFSVKSTNNDGVWNDVASRVVITILPPWWKSWWAVFLYVGLGIMVLYAFRALILMRANFIHDIKLERVQRENMEKLNRAKLQFFTNISHEFRTPLTLILGPLQHVMEAGGGSKFVRDQLHIINNNAQRLLRLVNQLLDFRKAETGNLKVQVSRSNLAKFIKEIKLSFDALAEEMNIDFTFYSSSNVVTAWFDRDQFEKILFNLLSNAFKHTPIGGRITIRLVESSSDIHISIEDSGKGINPEHFENIFQTFFSYDEDRHHTGTGIGLALTKSLVDAHHGIINVSRTDDHLTCFRVTLLAGSAHFDASEIGQMDADEEQIEHYPSYAPGELADTNESLRAATPIEEQRKLLIVEDNRDVRAYVKSIFRNNYVVLEAEDGKEGIQIAFEEIPDLIISDVMMPVMDGIAMTRRLKSNLRTSHIPVILLPARTSLIFKVEGLETGADDYVNKPFNPKVLQLKVRNLIRTRELIRKAYRDSEALSLEPRLITLTSTDETFIRKVLSSVEENMNNADYSVEELGTDIGMSRMQLYRKMKALTGQSANEFIRTIRLKRAAQLLVQDQMTVAEITYAVGFNDLQYFRECFKKQFNMTPSEYAQRNLQDPVSDPSN